MLSSLLGRVRFPMHNVMISGIAEPVHGRISGLTPMALHERLALQALLEQARLPTWRLWARDAAIEKKDVLKTRGYAWSPGEFGRPKCWYRDVSDADKAAEVSWLQANALGPNQAVWALRITARNRYSDRAGLGEDLWILHWNALPVVAEMTTEDDGNTVVGLP